jgi:hypothetical protein
MLSNAPPVVRAILKCPNSEGMPKPVDMGSRTVRRDLDFGCLNKTKENSPYRVVTESRAIGRNKQMVVCNGQS